MRYNKKSNEFEVFEPKTVTVNFQKQSFKIYEDKKVYLPAYVLTP